MIFAMNLKTFAILTSLLCVPSVCSVNIALAQNNDGWGIPDNSQRWGSSGQADQNAMRAARQNSDQSARALGKSLPDTPVVNPFDDSGVYMGESQALTNTGIDPASGMTVPDAPRQQ